MVRSECPLHVVAQLFGQVKALAKREELRQLEDFVAQLSKTHRAVGAVLCGQNEPQLAVVSPNFEVFNLYGFLWSAFYLAFLGLGSRSLSSARSSTATRRRSCRGSRSCDSSP